MTLAEATRLYQATLTACRSAVYGDESFEDHAETELEIARRQMEVAYLQHSIERPAHD